MKRILAFLKLFADWLFESKVERALKEYEKFYRSVIWRGPLRFDGCKEHEVVTLECGHQAELVGTRIQRVHCSECAAAQQSHREP